MKMILSFIKHPTSKNVVINTLGNYLNIGFTALFALLLVRILSPAQYGVMSVLLGIAYVLANVLDFGTTATIYSYFPNLYETKSERLYPFIKSTFFFQSLFSLIVIIILFIFFPYLDKVFFKTLAPVWELYLTAISVLFLIWQNFALNILFAAKKFVKANIILNITNVLKTVVILYFTWQHLIKVGTIIFVFGILGPVIFFILLFLEKRNTVALVLKAPVKRSEFKFGYTITYFVASQFYNLGQRMDLFILSFFGLKDDVGYYGLSQKIILTVISTVISITQVLSPGFAAITKKSEMTSHLKRAFLYLLIPTSLFIVIAILPPFVYSLLFTDRFVATAPLTRVLSIPYIVYTMGSIPMLFILYTIKKPKYILIANIMFFLLVSIGCFYYIPLRGVYAPPVVLLIAFVISNLYLVIVSIVEYRKIKATIK